MKTKVLRVTVHLIAGLLFLGSSLSFAQDKPPATKIGVGDGAIIHFNYKTPPMGNTDTITIPLVNHFQGATPPGLGWQGIVYNFQTLDPTEVDVDSVTSVGVGANVMNPFGPRSANIPDPNKRFVHIQQVMTSLGQLTIPSSGVDVSMASVATTFATIVLHAKNTNGDNSDVDVEIKGTNVWHVRPLTSSGVPIASQRVRLDASMALWVRSSIMSTGQLVHIPMGQPFASDWIMPEKPSLPPWQDPDSAQGHWLHLNVGRTFHLGTGAGSQYVANAAGIVMIGLEHIAPIVPEPTAGILAFGGVACLIVGHRARKRRLVQP